MDTSGGGDIHATDPWGRNALMCAAMHGQLEIAKILIEKGADINDIFQMIDEDIIYTLTHIQNEIEERSHLLTEKNVKKWEIVRLNSPFY